jgi:hypothetical protein
MLDNNTGTTCLRWSLRDTRTRAKTNTAEGNV